MELMSNQDWNALAALGNGKANTLPATARLARLIEQGLVIARFRKNEYSITGLGRDALMRRKYKLPLPQREVEPVEAGHAGRGPEAEAVLT